MSTRTQILDDISGEENATTVRFGFQDTTYEVDLAEANTTKLETALTPFIAVAREVVKRVATTSNASLIRAWAAGRDINVPAKGRIPIAITEQYEAAQAA